MRVRSIVFGFASAALCVGDAAAQSAGARTAAAPERRAAFRVLDNVEAPWVNLGVVPVRPMLVSPAGVFAVNTHGNTVVRIVDESDVESFPVPWGPVSIAACQVAGQDQLLVVCGGSHVLVRLDPTSGETLAMLDLPFEPADILVDPARNCAFISCSGADSVVRVNLNTNQITHTYPIRGKRPVFLSFDAHGRVLVAPQLSGNNSGTISSESVPLQADARGIVDFANDPNVITGLPDEDLFAIDPNLNSVVAVAKATGSVLFAQGRNPVTGKLWQLNTEANNKDPHKQTEASVRGFIVDNRLTIVDLPAPGAPMATNHVIVHLDDADPTTPGVQYDTKVSVGQPYALAFAPNGQAAICGLLTDNVVLLNSNGARDSQISLAAGSIPRGVEFDPTGQFLFVYCWGRNCVEAYSLLAPSTPLATVSLGFDPAPANVRAGRALFYSGRFSLNNNASCNSCHIEGRTDMLHWNLSDPLRDDKGPMVTQTLASIQRNGPMHWRGERKTLADFNGAFAKLLGGTPLDTTPGGEFDQFQAFVFSIQSPANPLENPSRIVADAGGLAPPASYPVGHGSAVRGQRLFFEGHQDVGRACGECHALPSGTSGDLSSTGKGDPLPKRTFFKVPQFLEMWRKEQPLVQVTFADAGPQTYPLLGGALTHAGRMNSLFDFIDVVFHFMPHQDTADLLAFISQADQGVAPAVHRCVHLSAATLPEAGTTLASYFLPQARARNIDIAVYGAGDFGHGLLRMRWAWNRASNLFDAEDTSLLSQPLGFFVNQAATAGGNFVFVGLPVGMGRSFAIDYDSDELLNGDETVFGTLPYVRDSDGDGFGDGHEIAHQSDPTDAQSVPSDATPPAVSNLRLMWVSSRVAAIAFDTDELTSCEIEYARAGETPQFVDENTLQRSRRVLLTGLIPGSGPGVESVYSGTLRVVDEAGNLTSVALPTIQAGDFFFEATQSGLPEAPFTVVVGDLTWTSTQTGPSGTLQATAVARVDKKLVVPNDLHARDHVVIATLLVNAVRADTFTSPQPTEFTVLGSAPGFPGPYVMSLPTQDDGLASLTFTIPGLSPGDRLTLVIEAVASVDPATYDPEKPDFGGPGNMIPLSHWSFPDTPVAARSLVFVY